MIDAKGYFDHYVDAIKNRRDLTEGERNQLIADVQTGPLASVCAGKTPREIWAIYHEPYDIPNPKPQFIDRVEWVCTDLINELKQMAIVNGKSAWQRLNEMSALSPDAWEAQDTLRALPVISMVNSKVAESFPILKAALGLSDADYAKLTTEEVKGWQPTVKASPRIKELFGESNVLLPEEFEEVLA